MGKVKIETKDTTLEIQTSNNCFDHINAQLISVIQMYLSNKPKTRKTKETWKNLQCPGKVDHDIIPYCHPTCPHIGPSPAPPRPANSTQQSDPLKPHSGLLGALNSNVSHLRLWKVAGWRPHCVLSSGLWRCRGGMSEGSLGWSYQEWQEGQERISHSMSHLISAPRPAESGFLSPLLRWKKWGSAG